MDPGHGFGPARTRNPDPGRQRELTGYNDNQSEIQ